MTHVRLPFVTTAVLAVFVLTAGAAGAQGSGAEPADDAAWTAPRTAFGHPDLQGVWANNNATPLQRPEVLGDRERLTDEELAAIRSRAEELFALDAGDAAFGDSVFTAALNEVESFSSRDTATGNYNQFWMVERDWDNRTSLIVDPPNGRIPERTQAARMRAEAASMKRQRHAVWTDDRSLGERCQSFGAPRTTRGSSRSTDVRTSTTAYASGWATRAATGTETPWSSRRATTRPSPTRWARPSTSR